jgi:hypothetical protein
VSPSKPVPSTYAPFSNISSTNALSPRDAATINCVAPSLRIPLITAPYLNNTRIRLLDPVACDSTCHGLAGPPMAKEALYIWPPSRSDAGFFFGGTILPSRPQRLLLSSDLPILEQAHYASHPTSASPASRWVDQPRRKSCSPKPKPRATREGLA